MTTRLTRVLLALIAAGVTAAVPGTAAAVAGTPAVTIATVTRASAVTAAVTVAAASCAPVWFIGARGSGESASGYDGMGPAVARMESVVAADLAAKGLAVTPRAVSYPADSVDVLKPDATVLKLVKAGEVAAATALWIHTSVDRYDSSMDKGITATESAVASVLRSCPDAKIVMAGYSQGAVALHDAENWLVNHEPGEFSHVVGTLLLGDPDRVPDSKARLFGSSPKQTELGKGLRVYLKLVRAHDVPDPATTAEIANVNDLVADFSLKDLTSSSFRTSAISTHTSYAHLVKGKMTYEPVLAEAANWIASLIPANPARSWTGVTTPVPQGGDYPYVTALACPSAADCVAVGFSQKSGVFQNLIVTGSGARWRPVAVPLPAGADGAKDASILSLACPSTAFCVAVGYYSDSAGRSHGLLVTISGTTARAVEAPLPAGGVQAQLFSVACTPASRCVAAGTYYDTNGYSHALLLASSGSPATAATSWAAVQAPLPTDAGTLPYSQIFAVTCPAANWCVAPASYWDGAGDTRMAWITGSGTAWQATEVPDPANIQPGSASGNECLWAGLSCLGNSGPYLFSASCTAAGRCAASGSYNNASGQEEGIVIRQSGSASAPVATALPLAANAGSVNGLAPMVCLSVLTCATVGAYQHPGSNGVPVIVTNSGSGSGSAWRLLKAPLPGPAAASGALLNSIACATAARCVAVGGYNNGDPDPAFLEFGSGASWSVGELPFTAADGALLDAVACSPSGTCTAIGAAGTSTSLLVATGAA